MQFSRLKTLAASLMARMRRVRSLKYIIVIVVAVALVGFIDENSVWSHIVNQRRITVLQAEISEQLSIYERDQKQLREMASDPKAVEKIARERYFMKADDEDIFVLSDDLPDEEKEQQAENDGQEQ